MQEREKLVQYNELSVAQSLTSPERIPLEQLHSWWQIAHETCVTRGFAGIAFNQFPGRTLGEIGFGGLRPRIIYLSSENTYEDPLCDRLMVNPTNFVIDSDGYYPNLEACGSITDRDGSYVWMFVMRPRRLLVHGWTWKPGEQKVTEMLFVAHSNISAIVHHEMEHLDGLTALSYPYWISDFRDPTEWEDIQNTYNTPETTTLESELAKHSPFLVFDASERQLLVVEIDGTVRGKFQ